MMKNSDGLDGFQDGMYNVSSGICSGLETISTINNGSICRLGLSGETKKAVGFVQWTHSLDTKIWVKQEIIIWNPENLIWYFESKTLRKIHNTTSYTTTKFFYKGVWSSGTYQTSQVSINLMFVFFYDIAK